MHSIFFIGFTLIFAGCESGDVGTYEVPIYGDTGVEPEPESNEPMLESNGTDGDEDEGHTSIYCADGDGDEYGDPNEALAAESVTSGYVADCTDCNDDNASVHPGAADSTTDGVDQDCSGSDYNGTTATTEYTWYRDADSDGYGTASTTTKTTTNTAPSGYVANSSDCDDTDAAVSPSDVEVTGNGKDDDCNSSTSDTASSSSSRSTWYVTASPDSSSTSWNLSIANVTASDWSKWFATTSTSTGTQTQSFSGKSGDQVYVNGLYSSGWLFENTGALACQEHLTTLSFGTTNPATTSYSMTTSTTGASCTCQSNGSGGWNGVCTLQ